MSDFIHEGEADAQIASPLYTITLGLIEGMTLEHVEIITPALEELSLAVTSKRDKVPNLSPWRVSWLVDFIPDRGDIENILRRAITMNGWDGLEVTDQSLIIESVIQENWLEKCYREFQPFGVGGFFIYGSHYLDGVPDGLTGLQIDAATAFGSGEHGTTKGCLLGLEGLVAQGFQPKDILDVGSGSGILAIAGYKRFPVPAIATDIDRESVRVAALHRDLNNVPEESMLSLLGDGYDIPEVQSGKPFDLIFANILAGPLKVLAPDLAASLSKDGYAILSGMLIEQADDVLAAHEACGMKLVKKYDIDGWSSLTLSF